MNNTYAADYLQFLLRGNRAMCSTIAKQFLSQNSSIKDLYEDVFKVALYEVGRLWESNKISVATEHLSTAITEGILNELYENLESENQTSKKVVLTCVESELHQVGIKMVADVFEMQGWESFFLGTGIPIQELIKFIHQTKPTILAISISIYFNHQNLLKMIDQVKAEFPELTIIIGGQALTYGQSDAFKKIEGTSYITNLYELEKYIKTF